MPQAEPSFGRVVLCRVSNADRRFGTVAPLTEEAFVPGNGHHDRVDATFEQFVTLCQEALGHLVEGRPDPFKALWSHADDVVIMGAFGGHERGWEKVSARLDWAAKGIGATDRTVENIVTTVGEDLAFTVDLEHMTRRVGDRTQPRTLRCTQAYRRENGQWKVVLRHADELPETDEHQGRQAG